MPWQGKYPIKPPLPSIPGHEGVAEVAALGNKASVRTYEVHVYAAKAVQERSIL